MAEAELDVRTASANDINSMSDALVKAFDDDPLMRFLFRSDSSRPRKMRALFVSESGRALKKGEVFTTNGDAAKGGAIWMAPGHWKMGGTELLGQIPLFARLGIEGIRGLSFLSVVEKAHPKEPHWYLAILGTDPQHQGKGIGSALIDPVLKRCDADGIPAYLESSKEQNIPFYRRHGFEIRDEISAKGSPPVWPMWRDPRPPE
jgi:ribosomal protein S18 acetylase RimI-like enzyme